MKMQHFEPYEYILSNSDDPYTFQNTFQIKDPYEVDGIILMRALTKETIDDKELIESIIKRDMLSILNIDKFYDSNLKSWKMKSS